MSRFYLRSLAEKLVKNLDKASDVSYKRNQINQDSELFVLDVDRRIIYVLIKPSGETTNYRVRFSTITTIFPGYQSVSSDWFEFTSLQSYVDIKKRILHRLREIRKEFGHTRGR